MVIWYNSWERGKPETRTVDWLKKKNQCQNKSGGSPQTFKYVLSGH